MYGKPLRDPIKRGESFVVADVNFLMIRFVCHIQLKEE